MILKAFDGVSSIVYTFGISQSGRNHTMFGIEGEPGFMTQTSNALFDQLEQRNKSEGLGFQIILSYFQVYHDTIRDLLIRDSPSATEIHEDPFRGTLVPGIA
jgi:hypothetical protein